MKSFFVVMLLLGVAANVVGCAGMSEIELIEEARKTGDWTKVNNRLDRLDRQEKDLSWQEKYLSWDEYCQKRGRVLSCRVKDGSRIRGGFQKGKCICVPFSFNQRAINTERH